MTPPPRSRPLLLAAAWFVVCALATTAALHTTPAWAKILCLIAAAAALRTAIKGTWRTARPAFRRATQREPAVVHLRGEISAATADKTTDRLTDALATRPTALKIDMSKVDLLTNDGAMAFLVAHRLAHEQGTVVTIRNASPQARATLHTLGMDRLQQYDDG